jgi:disulfide bond formation protein DsbB
MIAYSKAKWLALVIPALLLVGAYGFEYIALWPPCEMCWWQRYPLFAAIPTAIVGLMMPQPLLQRMLIGLAALAIFTSGAIGGFHAGVEYQWWQGLTSCASTFSATGADLERAIMDAPLIRCDQAPGHFLGISLAGYNFLLSCGAAIAILMSLWKKPLL